MKAAVWYGREDVRIEDVAEPSDPGKGEVKIKVSYCGICGTDLKEFFSGPIYTQVNNKHPLTGQMAPLIIGHEFSGTIAKVGKNVRSVKEGDRVAVIPAIGCGECFYCRQGRPTMCSKVGFIGFNGDGAFAEYINVKCETGKETVKILYKLPESITLEAGSLFEPLGCAIRPARENIRAGDMVFIIGAGPIGLAVIQTAKVAGASKIIVAEVSKMRSESAKKMGATHLIDPRKVDAVKEVFEITDGLGVDTAFEVVGTKDTAEIAINTTKRGGLLVIIGIFAERYPIDFLSMVNNERRVIAYLGCGDTFEYPLRMIQSGAFDYKPIISKIINLDDLVEKGYHELHDNKDRNSKILVKIF